MSTFDKYPLGAAGQWDRNWGHTTEPQNAYDWRESNIQQSPKTQPSSMKIPWSKRIGGYTAWTQASNVAWHLWLMLEFSYFNNCNVTSSLIPFLKSMKHRLLFYYVLFETTCCFHDSHPSLWTIRFHLWYWWFVSSLLLSGFINLCENTSVTSIPESKWDIKFKDTFLHSTN